MMPERLLIFSITLTCGLLLIGASPALSRAARDRASALADSDEAMRGVRTRLGERTWHAAGRVYEATTGCWCVVVGALFCVAAGRASGVL